MRMMAVRTVSALIGLLFASAICVASSASFHVHVKVRDNRVKPFSSLAETLCREWYPKINSALFGPDSPLPFRDVTVIFERSIVAGKGALSKIAIPAFTRGGVIRINSTYVAELHESDPNDYAGMLVHELTHVVQHNPAKNISSSGLTEGIADYVRHKYMEKDIEPGVRLDKNGIRQGLEQERNVADFETEGYKGGYTVAASFFLARSQERCGDRSLAQSRVA